MDAVESWIAAAGPVVIEHHALRHLWATVKGAQHVLAHAAARRFAKDGCPEAIAARSIACRPVSSSIAFARLAQRSTAHARKKCCKRAIAADM
eukprot:2666048-Prymnesium_polylepis.1